ncbi:MAG TPA: hydroxymethylbilane synthase [Candidatus Limnocylindria bacterium]|nr:hydroxymethylbilane synthase [Candidatus Limnocylindria bacterium]
MGERVVRIGTRGSALALAQARLVAQALAGAGQRHELVLVETEGDRRAPDTAWGEGAFVKAIEQALLDGRVDVAVHSAKDVPTDEDPRLVLACYLEREDPRDALVVAAASGGGSGSATVATLPAGSIVGTDSPRRAGFLRWLRPDLEVRPLHGNVDTRLARLDGGQADALLLAVAGLRRLSRHERITQLIEPEQVPPAPGQGAIAVQARAGDDQLIRLLRAIEHPPTRAAVEAERAFLRATGGGCRAPVGALAQARDGRLRLLGGLATADGRVAVSGTVEGPADDFTTLAADLAARLTAQRDALLDGPRVLLTRSPSQSVRLCARLAEHGLRAVVVPAVAFEPIEPNPALDAALAKAADFAWLAVTSANGASAALDACERLGLEAGRLRWAAVGGATAAVLRRAGAREVWLPPRSSGEGLADELPLEPTDAVLLARGDLADDRLPTGLRARGATVEEVVCYRTVEAPPDSRMLLRRALAGGPLAAVLFASPSAVRGLLALAGDEQRTDVLAVPAICIGPTTAAAARDAGFTLLGRAGRQDSEALASLAAQLLARPPAGAPA